MNTAFSKTLQPFITTFKNNTSLFPQKNGCKNNQEFLGCNIIQKKTENEIKPYSAIGLDGVLAVSVTNFPLSSIEKLFKNQIMGISRPAKSLETGIFGNLGYVGDGANCGDTVWIRQREYESDDYGIFKDSRDIRGGIGYWDGATVWICRGRYKGDDCTVILEYNSQKEINPEVKLVVKN